MNQRLLIYALLVIGVLVAFRFARPIWIVVLSAVVAGGVAYWVSRRFGGRPDTARTEPDSATRSAPKEPEAEWLVHLRRLLLLNVEIRENGLSEAVTARLEQMIDSLRRMLPDLNDRYSGSELTWTVNRMATDYLPRVVDPYMRLSPAARPDHEAELLASLEGAENELENIGELVRNHKVGDFKAKAAFLRARFLDGPERRD